MSNGDNNMQIIKVVNDEKKDNISLFLEEPTFVVVANRSDLAALGQLPQATMPGIYVLLGESQRYVGQASGSVISRLRQHDKNKDWWQKVIFFGLTNGGLDKSKLDYIEKKMINSFIDDTLFKVENNTNGNESFIEYFAKIEADQVQQSALHVLNDVANVDIFDDSDIQDVSAVVVVEDRKLYQLKLSDGKTFEGDSVRQLIDLVASYLVNNKQYEGLLLANRVVGKASFSNPIGEEENISSKGAKLTFEIRTDVHVYHNVSKLMAKRIIAKLASIARLEVISNLDTFSLN